METSEPEAPLSDPLFARLSEAPLWQWQRQYFESRGVSAWADYEVPQFVTSNAFIASWYARVLHRWIAALPADEPVTILELGAGSGRFSFGLIRRLALTGVRFRYIMTDLSRSNVDFWRNHAQLKPFVDGGILSFALFDPEHAPEIRLEDSQTVLRAGSFNGNLIVVANYFFDGIPHDAFAILGGELFEDLVSVDPAAVPDFTDNHSFSNLQIDRRQQLATSPVYDESAWDALLQLYKNSFGDTAILFPVSALQIIQRLQRLASGRLLVLSADHGPCTLEHLAEADSPSLLSHGSFSMPVNYHAIGAVTESLGGIYLAPGPKPSHLSVVGLAFGLNDHESHSISSAYHDEMRTLGPDAFYTLKKSFEQMSASFNPATMLAFLQLAQADSDLFRQLFPSLLPHLVGDPATLRSEWLRMIEDVWAGYFPIGEADDLAGAIAGVLLTLQQPGRSLEYLRRAEALGYLSPQNRVRMADARYAMGDLTAALQEIEIALDRDPTYTAARTMKLQLEEEQRWRKG